MASSGTFFLRCSTGLTLQFCRQLHFLIPTFTYLHAFAAALLWLTLFAALGCLLHYLLRLSRLPFLSFEHAVTGILLSVPACAIWFTNGQTVLAPVPLLLIIVLTGERRQSAESDGRELFRKSLYALGFGACALYFLFFAQAFRSPDAAYIKYPSGDLAYYCRLARHITHYGVENRLVDLPARLQGMSQPYHWGDMWMIPLTAKLSGLSEESALLLVVYPVLCAVFIMGLYSLYEAQWKRRRGILVVLCLCAPLIAAFTDFFPAPLRNRYNLFPVPMAQYPKVLLYGTLLLWILQRAKRHDRSGIIPAAMASGLMVAGGLPSLVFCAGCFVLWTGQLNASVIRATLVPGAIVGLWGLYIYGRQSAYVPYLPAIAGDHNIAFPGWRFLLIGLVHAGMLLPFFFVLAAFMNHDRRPFRWLAAQMGPVEKFLAGWLMMSFLSWLLLHRVSADSFQFFGNALIMLPAIFSVCCATLYFQSAKGLWAGGALLLLVAAGVIRNGYFGRKAFLTDKISASDYAALKALLARHPGNGPLRCVSLKSPVHMDRQDTRNSTVFYPLEVLSLVDAGYTVTLLDAVRLEDIDPSAPNRRESLAMRWYTPLMQAAHERGMQDALPDAIICDYVRQAQPQWLIAANDAVVPAYLLPATGSDSLQLDSKPYRVFRLKYP